MNILVFFSGLLLLPSLVLAAGESAMELSPILVTASRIAQTADETLASVSVVTREEIERRQVRSVPEALRGLPGVTLTNSGGAGKLTSVSLRGTNASHVLVLVDGVRIGSATAGLSSLETLPIEQIERIEIVRGPRSSRYGSEAIGGVIQIFTRRGGGALRPRLAVGAGSDRTLEGALGLSGGGDDHWFDGSVSFAATEGFDACRGEPLTGGCFAIEPDRDGYRNRAGSLRLGSRFPGGELGLHGLRSENDLEFDGLTNTSRGWIQILGADARFTPREFWDLQLAAGRSWDRLNGFSDGLFSSHYETLRDTLTWQNDLDLGAGRLATLGLDYVRDQVDGSLDFAEDSRTNWALFGQFEGDFGAHRASLSLRHDDNEQFGRQVTGDAAWGYGFANGLRLTLSYGTAFRAPSFNDLYYPFEDFGDGFGYAGNPDLEPETSRSLELGLSGEWSLGSWGLQLYQTDLEDLIALDTLSAITQPVNVAEARLRGLEGTLGMRFPGNWTLDASLTLLDPENRTPGDHAGNRLARRPEQSLRLDLERDLGRYRLGATLFAAGRSFDDLANEVRLDGYAVLDLRAEYRLSDRLRLHGRIGNLFDEDYETLAYFNQPGREFFFSLRYQP